MLLSCLTYQPSTLTWREYVPPQRRWAPTASHSVTSHKAARWRWFCVSKWVGWVNVNVYISLSRPWKRSQHEPRNVGSPAKTQEQGRHHHCATPKAATSDERCLAVWFCCLMDSHFRAMNWCSAHLFCTSVCYCLFSHFVSFIFCIGTWRLNASTFDCGRKVSPYSD
jgi:hypothetical protein